MAYQYDIPFHVDLSDRVALVTGGNGGIGGMFCRALAACGATVIILARNLERCQQLAAEINAGGATALGGALNVLIDCVNSEVRKSTETQKGDWRPLVFILTDGSPTDIETFREAAQRIKGMKAANIIACAAGSNANTSYLKEITESVLMMNTLSAGDMAQFFAWVSGSVKMSSKTLDTKPGAPIELPPPPQGFVVVP